MRVLITGAAGAVGSIFAKKFLEHNDEIVSILHDGRPNTSAKALGVHDKITWAHGDIVNEMLVKRVIADYEIESVVHLAALPIVKSAANIIRPVFEVNLMGTLSILEAIKEQTLSGNDISLVAVATDKVYGMAEYGRKYKESDPLLANAPYETSKACMDMVVRMYHNMEFAKNCVVLRPSNMYGPADFNSRIIPNTIRKCLKGESPVIYKGMTYVREFTFTDEVARAAILALVNIKNVSGKALNVGSGEGNDQTSTIMEVLKHFPGLKPVYEFPPTYTRKEIPYQLLDSTLIERELGWKNQVKFEDGIKRTVRWWKEWKTQH